MIAKSELKILNNIAWHMNLVGKGAGRGLDCTCVYSFIFVLFLLHNFITKTESGYEIIILLKPFYSEVFLKRLSLSLKSKNSF